jgi:soluble lytic murein transglycosylase-like protein
MMGLILIVVGSILAVLLIVPKKLKGTVAEVRPAVTPSRGTGETIDSIIASNARRYGVEEALIRAIIKVESDFNPNAVNPSDPSYGLMQIMPILAEDFGYVRDWRNVTEAEIAMIRLPETNVQIGTRFLAKLLSKYPQGVTIQMYNVGEAGYNSGHRAAEYLSKVTGYYNEYKSY